MPTRWRWILLSIVVILWTTSLLTPLPISESDDPEITSWIPPLSIAVHVISYALVTTAAGWLQVEMPRRLWLLFALCSHALLTELIQPYVGRDGNLLDVALDQLGILLGLLIGRRYWFANP